MTDTTRWVLTAVMFVALFAMTVAVTAAARRTETPHLTAFEALALIAVAVALAVGIGFTVPQ